MRCVISKQIFKRIKFSLILQILTLNPPDACQDKITNEYIEVIHVYLYCSEQSPYKYIL